jgi:cobalt-zinc-cadmium efflux system membrane fusion protein
MLAVALLALPLVAPETVRLDAEAERRAGVVVEAARTYDFGDTVSVVGQIERAPGATVTVRTILHGHIESISVTPGQMVRAGDVLMELHSHELQEMKAELLTAIEAERLAETLHESGMELLQIEGISQLEVRDREHRLLVARLHARTLRSTLLEHGVTEDEISQLVVDANPGPELHIHAPIDGVILQLNVHEHGWTEQLQALVVMGDPASYELQIQVPTGEAGNVEPGDTVEFRHVGDVAALGRARVSARLPEVDPLTRTVVFRCDIVEGLDRVLPGELVEATLRRGERVPHVGVPAGAIGRVDQQDHVFVRLEPGLYEARPVRLGIRDGDTYQIVQGIEAGEEVAVAGVFLLKSALLRDRRP